MNRKNSNDDDDVKVEIKEGEVVKCDRDEVEDHPIFLRDKCLVCPYFGRCKVRGKSEVEVEVNEDE